VWCGRLHSWGPVPARPGLSASCGWCSAGRCTKQVFLLFAMLMVVCMCLRICVCASAYVVLSWQLSNPRQPRPLLCLNRGIKQCFDLYAHGKDNWLHRLPAQLPQTSLHGTPCSLILPSPPPRCSPWPSFPV
jgi:hypothetical protein